MKMSLLFTNFWWMEDRLIIKKTFDCCENCGIMDFLCGDKWGTNMQFLAVIFLVNILDIINDLGILLVVLNYRLLRCNKSLKLSLSLCGQSISILIYCFDLIWSN